MLGEDIYCYVRIVLGRNRCSYLYTLNIYIYICVCVCVCVSDIFDNLLSASFFFLFNQKIPHNRNYNFKYKSRGSKSIPCSDLRGDFPWYVFFFFLKVGLVYNGTNQSFFS